MRRPELSLPRRQLFAAASAFLLAACSGSAPATFDLSAPRGPLRDRGNGQTLVIVEPASIQVFDAERIVARAGPTVTYLPDVQWADRLPKLLQSRLVETFENAGRFRSVGRPADRLTADFNLVSEIRALEVRDQPREAVVELSVKLVGDRTGKIAAGKVFAARVPVGAIDGATAAQAIDQALTTVLVDIVAWAR